MEIFDITKQFPHDEMYALTRQLRNAARSVAGNIAEGWSKRRYPNVFKRQLTDAIGSADETTVWLDMAADCGHILHDVHAKLLEGYASVGKMLHRLIDTWRTFK